MLGYGSLAFHMKGKCCLSRTVCASVHGLKRVAGRRSYAGPTTNFRREAIRRAVADKPTEVVALERISRGWRV